MITIDSEWHAYFSIYAQFGSNLSIYMYLYWCCRANLCKKSSALLLFHIYLMDVPIHVHNGARFFRCVCTCDSIIGYFFHHHTHSNMFHSFFWFTKCGELFFLLHRHAWNALSENGQLNWVIITLIGRIKKSLTFSLLSNALFSLLKCFFITNLRQHLQMEY